MSNIFDDIDEKEIIVLAGRDITSLNGMPQKLPMNKKLQLQNNNIKSLHEMPKELPKNEILDLYNNQIASLNGMPASLPKNKELCLNHNQIASLEGIPKNLPDNRDLCLNNNNLASLKGMPTALPMNVFLSLHNNQLTSLEGMPDVIPKNEELHLDNNHLVSLEWFPKLPNLELLTMENNPFKSLHGLPRSNYHAVEETITTRYLSSKGKNLVRQCFRAKNETKCDELYRYYEKSVHDLITKQKSWTKDEIKRICHELSPEDVPTIHHNEFLRNDPRIQKCAVTEFPLKNEYSIVL